MWQELDVGDSLEVTGTPVSSPHVDGGNGRAHPKLFGAGPAKGQVEASRLGKVLPKALLAQGRLRVGGKLRCKAAASVLRLSFLLPT